MLSNFFGLRRPRESVSTIPLRILTHNIRYATESPFKNERSWEDRLPLILSQFRHHTRFVDGCDVDLSPSISSEDNHAHAASFICLQEVLHGQLQDILDGLNGKDSADKSLWNYVGVGRDDGEKEGEYNPIFYPSRTFNLLHFETTWLSPTPDEPSKGWGAGSKRILTTGVFQHRFTKQKLVVFNTHLDNASSEAREKGVGVILEVIQRVRRQWTVKTTSKGWSETNGDRLSYVLAGDFNSFPTQEAYQAMVASNTAIDAHEVFDDQDRYGSENTFTGFQPDTDVDKDEIGRIDYIWYGPKSKVHSDINQNGDGWTVKGYSVLPNVFDDGIFCSDHRCIVADAVLAEK